MGSNPAPSIYQLWEHNLLVGRPIPYSKVRTMKIPLDHHAWIQQQNIYHVSQTKLIIMDKIYTHAHIITLNSKLILRGNCHGYKYLLVNGGA